MPRILVTTSQPRHSGTPVLLDEWVAPLHLSDGYAAEQLVQRLGWALADAEELEEVALNEGHDASTSARRAENGGTTSFAWTPRDAKLRS
jgi:hypothetical protein